MLRQKELELGELRQSCATELSKQKLAEDNLLHVISFSSFSICCAILLKRLIVNWLLLQLHGQLASTSATCESLQRQIESLQGQLETQISECNTQKQRARDLEQTLVADPDFSIVCLIFAPNFQDIFSRRFSKEKCPTLTVGSF